MSRMGLYMSTAFAKGGGMTEVEIMKEQKNLLERIAENTENSSSEYSE